MKSSIRPPEFNFVVLNFVARWAVILTLNTCVIDVELRQRVVREKGYHVHEDIWEASQHENSICADPFTVTAAFHSK